MKHNVKITIVLLVMFLITQLIGLFVISQYTKNYSLPYGMQPPENIDSNSSFGSLLIAFPIAILLFFLLSKLKAENFIRIWFFLVTILAISLTLNVIFSIFNISYPSIIALIIATPFAYFKIFKRDIIVHNFTELMIYPGIAAVFVPILNIFWMIILLLLISFYDIWAVWKSQFMQKMANLFHSMMLLKKCLQIRNIQML